MFTESIRERIYFKLIKQSAVQHRYNSDGTRFNPAYFLLKYDQRTFLAKKKKKARYPCAKVYLHSIDKDFLVSRLVELIVRAAVAYALFSLQLKKKFSFNQNIFEMVHLY